MTQYISCRFPNGREYSYANGNDPVRIGDFVDVETPSGGIKTIEVVGILDGPPNLPAHVQLKSIIGLSQGFPED